MLPQRKWLNAVKQLSLLEIFFGVLISLQISLIFGGGNIFRYIAIYIIFLATLWYIMGIDKGKEAE
jgi:hypothetical protein